VTASPRLPQIQMCPIKASGSLCHASATGRHTEWTARAGGSGVRFSMRMRRSQDIRLLRRRRRDSQRFQIQVAALRNRASASELPVMP
jgi:hypothetical protein